MSRVILYSREEHTGQTESANVQSSRKDENHTVTVFPWITRMRGDERAKFPQAWNVNSTLLYLIPKYQGNRTLGG
jgi:hypothetical protein